MPDNGSVSYGLFIGVGKREADADEMAISASDAANLRKASIGTRLIPAENIQVLTNEQATTNGIRTALQSLADQTKDAPADLIVIYFSGHGAKINNRYFLVSHDTTVENILTNGLEGDAFRKALSAIQCDKLLVLLDCCHAAGFGDNPIPFNEQPLLTSKNRVIITACAKQQLSFLSQPVSLFTYALIEALSGTFLKEGDSRVTLFNLAMDVRERVAALSATALHLDEPQQPQLNVLPESATTNFTLTTYPNGHPAPLPLLREELKALTTPDGKSIDVSVAPVRDEKYRNQFNWLQKTNIVQDIGDGNIVIQDSAGPITINIGISDAQLKDILSGLAEKDKVIQELTSTLTRSTDKNSAQLLGKVNNAERLVQQEKDMYESSVALLIKKLEALVRGRILSYDPIKSFALDEEITDTNSQISDLKEKIAKLKGK